MIISKYGIMREFYSFLHTFPIFLRNIVPYNQKILKGKFILSFLSFSIQIKNLTTLIYPKLYLIFHPTRWERVLDHAKEPQSSSMLKGSYNYQIAYWGFF